MRKIKATSQRGQAYIYAVDHNTDFYLDSVYKTYSREKYNAWLYCKNLCDKEDGRGFCIISHNTFGFSVGWILPNGNYRIETPNNSYVIM